MAIDVTLFGPNTFTRTTGKPNVFNGTFPAIPGQGTLYVFNGSAKGKDRVSSGSILVNGVEVISTDIFNQNVGSIEVDLPRFDGHLEKPGY